MTRIRFQQSLEDLKENLLVMAGLAEQAIQRAIEAYRVRDLSICDLVSRSEIAINRMERDIDQAALDLLAMEQPMAIDLRFISQRHQDQRRPGARGRRRQEHQRPRSPHGAHGAPSICPSIFRAWPRWLPTWCARACRRSSKADAELARSVLTMDDAVDQMNRAAYKALTKVMEEQSHLAPQALNALMICRSLERVADHATNIAEDVIFWVQGADVRHHKSVSGCQASCRRRPLQLQPRLEQVFSQQRKSPAAWRGFFCFEQADRCSREARRATMLHAHPVQLAARRARLRRLRMPLDQQPQFVECPPRFLSIASSA